MPGLTCSTWYLCCRIWDLAPWPGLESPSGAGSLSHWTTREVPMLIFFDVPSLPNSWSLLYGLSKKAHLTLGLQPRSLCWNGVLTKYCIIVSNLVCLNLFFFSLATPHCLRDLSSLTRDWTSVLGSESIVLTSGSLGNFQVCLHLNHKRTSIQRLFPFLWF